MTGKTCLTRPTRTPLTTHTGRLSPTPRGNRPTPVVKELRVCRPYRVHLCLAPPVNIMGHLQGPTILHKTLVTKTTFLLLIRESEIASLFSGRPEYLDSRTNSRIQSQAESINGSTATKICTTVIMKKRNLRTRRMLHLYSSRNQETSFLAR